MKNLSGIRRLGIVGGTFNPIHMGHLRSAEEVREAFDLERIVFIVSAVPPHKRTEGIIEAAHRYEMARRAVRTNPYFIASDIEIRRKGTSYTVDTLSHFRGLIGADADIYFILGLDAFNEIGTWKNYTDLFGMAHFVVTDRPAGGVMEPKCALPPVLSDLFTSDGDGHFTYKSAMRLYFHNITGLDISATQIRGLVEQKRSIRYLVPEVVERYIHKKGLYR